MKPYISRAPSSSIIRALFILWAGAQSQAAWSTTGQVLLADRPVVVDQTDASLAKPNIAFVVDDSGSMTYQNMPQNEESNRARLCRGWYKYNTLAYNPSYTYKPPYDPDGTTYTPDGVKRYPDAVFTAALEDGYFEAGGATFSGGAGSNTAIDLSNPPFPLISDDDEDEDDDDDDDEDNPTKYYYTYVPAGSQNISRTDCLRDNRYTAVTSAGDIEAPGVQKGSPEAKKNYANWYSYYRRRGYLMKAATGEAFRNLDESFRVGLFFINSVDSGADRANSGNRDLPISTFDETSRLNWYRTLYESKGDGTTPLRGALARMGRMYAGQFSGWDPVQYSCQQNFTILSTDGYWNTGGETSSYTALKIKGEEQQGQTEDGLVGNVDSGAPRPYYDGGNQGQGNTLADIAYYYYTSDLRNSNLGNCTNTDSLTANDLCEDNVRGSGTDQSSKQHMTTYTIGLGVGGTITYESDYETAPDISGVRQYYDIANGNTNWPRPSSSERAKIDDVWHAAVNGRGRYYSASDSTSLYQGIRKALSGLRVQTGSASAAATSSLEPIAGDNAVYVALYETVTWSGDVKAYSIDPVTGNLNSTVAWSAQTELDEQVAESSLIGEAVGRDIRFFDSDAADGTKLSSFEYDNLDTTEKAHFTNICAKAPQIDQCGDDGDDLIAAQKVIANDGTNLVNYLRGNPVYEDKASNDDEPDNKIYRGRSHLLGDIVHGAPVYVKKPAFNYDDPTYAVFKSEKSGRDATVYVAANDGMLHAINAENGRERWAYVPKFVMQNMWKLADRQYDHRYFVDGAPTVADICILQKTGAPQLCESEHYWRTILVGGLNKGGCGYYALDITDPTAPKGLWEFQHDNLGYSFGNPLVAKNKDGRWVVMFTSGYNNIPGVCGKPTGVGDGNGHVFVLDAEEGTLLDTISTFTSGATPAGTAAEPSGLGKMNAWIGDARNPVAQRLYAGDLKGNLWRIDFDNNHAPSGKEAVLLAQLKDGTTNRKPQPITIKPELAVVDQDRPVILVGTGKLLDSDDLTNTDQQSLYAIEDSLEESGIADIRGDTMVQLTLTQTTGAADGPMSGRTIRKVSAGGVNWNWSTHDGWYMDFDPDDSSPGERVNVDMNFQLGALTLATNVPSQDACSVGGYAFLYFFDIQNGGPLSKATEQLVGTRLSGNALVAGMKVLRLPSGDGVVVITDTAGNIRKESMPDTGGGVTLRRTAWRELID
jgi:type IV pilus assembly protein PilY1